MKLLYGHNEEVADWVARRIPYIHRRMHESAFGMAFGPSRAIGVIDAQGVLVAGVVYHGYDPWCKSIELSFAADTRKWLTRNLIRELMGYPFDTIGVNRVTGVTPKRAKAARVFLDKFGFKREGVARSGFGEDDAIISGLLAKEWRQSKYAQAHLRRAEAA